MPYVDPNTVHNPSTGTVAPAAWGDVVRDDLEFLIDPPACSVFNSGNQSVPTATVTVLTANSEFFDNDGMHSTVTNNSRITAQTAGRYLTMSAVSFATGTGSRTVSFLLNGSSTLNAILLPAVSGNVTRVVALRLITLAAGEYVETRVSQDSGGGLDVALVEFGATYLTR